MAERESLKSADLKLDDSVGIGAFLKQQKPLDLMTTQAKPSAAAIPDQRNFQAAMATMNLSPQEQELYQRHLTNLYGPGGVEHKSSGARSTLYQITVGFGDKSYVIPTVWNGKIVPEEQAIANARAYGLDRFPSYATVDEAESRYQQMHGFMEQDMKAHLGNG